jgi:hypothetical protein
MNWQVLAIILAMGVSGCTKNNSGGVDTKTAVLVLPEPDSSPDAEPSPSPDVEVSPAESPEPSPSPSPSPTVSSSVKKCSEYGEYDDLASCNDKTLANCKPVVRNGPNPFASEKGSIQTCYKPVDRWEMCLKPESNWRVAKWGKWCWIKKEKPVYEFAHGRTVDCKKTHSHCLCRKPEPIRVEGCRFFTENKKTSCPDKVINTMDSISQCKTRPQDIVFPKDPK